MLNHESPHDKQDYTAAMRISANPSDVLIDLTTLANLSAWWAKASGDPKEGGDLEFDFNAGSPLRLLVAAAGPMLVQWNVLAYEPVPDWAGTTITFELSDRLDGTCDLSFRHQGLTPALECFTDCKSGWDHFLPSLKNLAETGTGNPQGSVEDMARRAVRAAVRTDN